MKIYLKNDLICLKMEWSWIPAFCTRINSTLNVSERPGFRIGVVSTHRFSDKNHTVVVFLEIINIRTLGLVDEWLGVGS
jgi:hypothetical protein